jgi:hypothetical protein
LKKGVDKWESVWYSNKAVAEVTTSAREKQQKAEYRTDRKSKNFLKNLKKVLDKRNEV